jgi:ubiquinone/menaquinone biosynthesis C-methylase UbiE
MRDHDASLRKYYAARAREYEQIYSKPERQADIAQLQLFLPEFFANCKVLEVACGTGYWTSVLLQTAKKIVAVDVSPETLDVAGEKSWPKGRVTFRIADAYALPENLGTFDAAFAGFWWSHMPLQDRAAFLRSLDRCLLAGAKILFLDNLFVEGSSTPSAHRDVDGNTYQRRHLNDGSEHLVLKNFPSEPELRAEVADFGQNVQFIALQYYWVLSYEKHRTELR